MFEMDKRVIPLPTTQFTFSLFWIERASRMDGNTRLQRLVAQNDIPISKTRIRKRPQSRNILNHIIDRFCIAPQLRKNYLRCFYELHEYDTMNRILLGLCQQNR